MCIALPPSARKVENDISLKAAKNTKQIASNENRRLSSPSSSNDSKGVLIHHNYHDYVGDAVPLHYATKKLDDYRNHNAFPFRLYEMLERVEREGLDHVVSWQPHGRCFVVHQAEEFQKILPRFFRLSKISSFQRQLNLYGFVRLSQGLDKGGYYHENFLRGRHWLVLNIHRERIKGTGVRPKANPSEEPDFWSMTWSFSTVENSGNDQVSSACNTIITERVQQSCPCSPSHVDESASVGNVCLEDREWFHLQNQPQEHRLSTVSSSCTMITDSTASSIAEVRPLSAWGMPFYYLSEYPDLPHMESSKTEDSYIAFDDLFPFSSLLK